MRARMLLGWLGLVLLSGIGCDTTRNQIKPPVRPEEFRDPPINDARYVEPVRYPKGTLNQDIPRPEIVPAAAGGSKEPMPGMQRPGFNR